MEHLTYFVALFPELIGYCMHIYTNFWEKICPKCSEHPPFPRIENGIARRRRVHDT
jgi:hypothetical protein